MVRVTETVSTRFGAEVRRLRLERGLSQESLAAMAELDRTFVSMVERGVRRPTLDSAERIAVALELPLSEVILSAEKLGS